VLALLIALIASEGGSGGTPAAAAAKKSHPVHHAAAVHKVTIDPTLYIGQPWPAVRDALTGMGVVPTPQYAGKGPSGTVLGLAPTGKVAKGTVVTVVVARSEPAKHPEPHKAPKPEKHGPGPAHVPPGHAKHFEAH
jgi:beta-lactam-binding protein with PASTA domain